MIQRISLILFSLLLASCDPAPIRTAVSEISEVMRDPAPIRTAKSEISEVMRDPKSAEFRNVRMFDLDSYSAVCGEVNAKNAFGAMVGYMHFLYIDPLMRIASTAESDLAVYSCCNELEKNGTAGAANNTLEVEECSAIDPPMAL